MKLLNLFKKEAILSQKGIEVLDNIKLKNKSTKEIIEEIHESFYTEVDKLLADSKILRSTDTHLQNLIDKSTKLKALGFNNTKECKDADIEIDRIRIISEENSSKTTLNQAIDYFTAKYPLNKFITEESVVKICNKYGLVYGEINKYLGTVPDKNLKEIENSKIQNEDKLYNKIIHSNSLYGTNRITSISYEEYNNKCEIEEISSDYFHYSYHKSNLEIAAPQKDFDMKGFEIQNSKLTLKKIDIPDPVVLQPVLFKNNKYYLILSAWGDEASDELVVNNINN